MHESKKEVISYLKKEVKTWNLEKQNYYQCSKKEMKNFIADIKIGYYDKLLEEEEDYFLPSVISWHQLRLKRQTRMLPTSPITKENYQVYIEIKKILEKINKQIIEEDMMSLPSQTKLQEIIQIYQNILITDYKTEEVKTIKELIKNLQDPQLFHPETLRKTFFPQLIKLSAQYEKQPVVKETKKVRNLSQEMQEEILTKDIKNIFKRPIRSKEENYLRRMILSQIDIPATVYENFSLFFRPAIDSVREDLNEDLTLEEETQELLWGRGYKKEKIILPLVMSVLNSLSQQPEPIEIKKELEKIQQENNCSATMVTRKDQNRLHLGNMTTIRSLDPKKIPSFLEGLEKKYQLLYQEASDYEFIEGCIEIMGDLMMSQIFLEGNKRTAKCLFNKLLMSRGLLPPVIDLNEDELALWEDFTNSRNLEYIEAKTKILNQEKEMAEQWQEDYYDRPLIISPAAVSRPDFSNKYYRR